MCTGRTPIFHQSSMIMYRYVLFAKISKRILMSSKYYRQSLFTPRIITASFKKPHATSQQMFRSSEKFNIITNATNLLRIFGGHNEIPPSAQVAESPLRRISPPKSQISRRWYPNLGYVIYITPNRTMCELIQPPLLVLLTPVRHGSSRHSFWEICGNILSFLCNIWCVAVLTWRIIFNYSFSSLPELKFLLLAPSSTVKVAVVASVVTIVIVVVVVVVLVVVMFVVVLVLVEVVVELVMLVLNVFAVFLLVFSSIASIIKTIILLL